MENICQMLSILSVQNTALKPIVLDFDIVLVGKMKAIECNGAKEPQQYDTDILENQTHIRIQHTHQHSKGDADQFKRKLLQNTLQFNMIS